MFSVNVRFVSACLSSVMKFYCFLFCPRIASRRALYDKFGEDGLKGGIPTSDGGAIFNVYSLLHAAQLHCMSLDLQSIPLGTLSMEMQIECSRTFSEETTHFQV